MNVVAITCYKPGCGYSPFPMERQFYERARETHEYWHCPAGHQQHFVGETETETLKRENLRLRGDVTRWRRRAEWAESYTRCPWPGCDDDREMRKGGPLSIHLQRRHGALTLAEVALLASTPYNI